MRDLALVEDVRAFVGDSGERVGEMRNMNRVAGIEERAVGMVQRVVTVVAAIENELA